jgi:hypothetical protein
VLNVCIYQSFTCTGHSQSKPEGDPEFKNGAGDQALPGEQDESSQKGILYPKHLKLKLGVRAQRSFLYLAGSLLSHLL